RRVDARRRLGAHPRQRRPVQSAARARLPVDRLPALHVRDRARREPARRPLARRREDRVRATHERREGGRVMSSLYPVFLKLDGVPVLVVGGGAVAASKLDGLVAAGARVTVGAAAVFEAVRAEALGLGTTFWPSHSAG